MNGDRAKAHAGVEAQRGAQAVLVQGPGGTDDAEKADEDLGVFLEGVVRDRLAAPAVERDHHATFTVAPTGVLTDLLDRALEHATTVGEVSARIKWCERSIDDARTTDPVHQRRPRQACARKPARGSGAPSKRGRG